MDINQIKHIAFNDTFYQNGATIYLSTISRTFRDIEIVLRESCRLKLHSQHLLTYFSTRANLNLIFPNVLKSFI